MPHNMKFNGLCAEYQVLSQQADDFTARAREIKAQLVALIQSEGFVPPNAELSLRLEDADYIGTVTTGTTVDVDHAKVTELELMLSAAKRPSLFKQLFTRRVEYTLLKGADEVVKQAGIPRTLQTRFTTLWGQCFKVKAKSPSLKVEERKQLEQKPARGTRKGGHK